MSQYIRMWNGSKKSPRIDGRATNDKANAFIWSGFQYYLRQPTDSFILFSPIKYWKYQHLVNKRFIGGYLFNKKWFHAKSVSAVCCILWSNEDDYDTDEINLPVWDIAYSDDGEMESRNLGFIMPVKKTHSLLSAFYDKRSAPTDEKGIVCGYSGEEQTAGRARLKGKAGEDIIGYLIAQAATFENPRMLTNLFRVGLYNGNGFHLRSDNYMEKLPLFATGKYPVESKWWENGTKYKSFDGGNAFIKDQAFLDDCLIFTCLSQYNKCRSFKGSDGRDYRN